MAASPDSKLRLSRAREAWWIELASRNNTVGSTLMTELEAALEDHARDPSAKVLVLRGSGSKFFCPGLDLAEVATLKRPEMAEFMTRFRRLYRRLFAHPKPTLAALNGHAVAGGAILACCCDFRVAKAGVRIGLTELNQVVPIPYGSLRILERRIHPSSLREALFLGLNYAAEEASGWGWVDEVVGEDSFADRLTDRVERLRSQEGAVFAVMKAALVETPLREIEQHEDRAASIFLDCWFSDVTQARIQELLRRLRRKA